MARWEHTKTAIRRGEVSLSLPSTITDWEDDMKKWPRITYASIFSYVINAVACDGEAMDNMKSAEAYQYLHSNKVGPVLIKAVGNDMVYLRSNVEPSQTLTVPHHQAWVLALISGEVQTAGCSCIAGAGRSCSHAAAIMWKVENAVREGKTGLACTDVQQRWNAGTKKNVGLKKVKNINFKHHKPDHTISDPLPSSSSSDPTPSPHIFKNHAEFKSHVDASTMAPLFQLPTGGLLQLCYRAKTSEARQAVEGLLPFSHIPHTAHGTELSCEKCHMFYESYINLTPQQSELLTRETQTQSHSQMWHDARMLRLTASTAKKVPKRLTTDPAKFINEHLYPIFMGNTATKTGQAYEDKAIQMQEERGNSVERNGLVLHPDHPWFGASPDGVLNQTQLLEVKSPQGSLAEFLQRPHGDIRPLDDGPLDNGQFLLVHNGKGGYYQQIQLTMLCMGLESCKLVIWTPSESLEFDVPINKDYAEKQMHTLQGFYFMHMLPRLVDDFLAKKVKLCLRYLELLKSD